MSKQSKLKTPFLKRVSLVEERIEGGKFPFNQLDWLRDPDFAVEFPGRVTFFVGENGTGKSTVLEAIAALCGFPVEGGSQDHVRTTTESDAANALADAMRPSWLPRVRTGFFLRAESFFGLAGYVDEVGDVGLSGGKELREQSHGESVLALLSHRLGDMERSVILMDEPEAALSPSRQLAFLGLLRQWDAAETNQIIIATHSPIILSYPGATIWHFDEEGLSEVSVEQTDHYRVTKAFLSNPDKYLSEIFGEDQA